MSESRDVDFEIIMRKKLLELMRGGKKEKKVVSTVPAIVEVKSSQEFGQWLSRASREGKAVFVDFWAPWCAPCIMLAPIYKRLASKFRDKALFLKVNVDEVPELASRYGVFSIPTLLAICNKREIDAVIGYQPERVLEVWITRVINACS